MTEHMEVEVSRHLSPVEQMPEANFEALMTLAIQLVPTGFLPDHIKTPGQAVAIILTGREMGVGPMQSLRSIVMVKGKPTVSADLQLAVFKRNGGRAEFTELSQERAVLHLTHPNGDQHIETFTLADARAAGIANDNYRKWPKAMLRSRAITAGLKSVGFEPCAGAYDPDELSDVTRNGQPTKQEAVEEAGPIVGVIETAATKSKGEPIWTLKAIVSKGHEALLRRIGWKVRNGVWYTKDEMLVDELRNFVQAPPDNSDPATFEVMPGPLTREAVQAEVFDGRD